MQSYSSAAQRRLLTMKNLIAILTALLSLLLLVAAGGTHKNAKGLKIPEGIKATKIEPEIIVETAQNFSNFEATHKAEHCTLAKCKLPNCRCSGMPLPRLKYRGKEKQIPQFVTITFDDAVNIVNFEQYKSLFEGLINPDNCTATGTFFVSHEYTDYVKLNTLYNAGHEIALHSVTHGDGVDYWRQADVERIVQEFGAEIKILANFAKINPKDIRGMRLPFLQIVGNATYVAAKRLGLLYDSSWPTLQHQNPAMWPYTLDYASVQDCQIGPCPNAAVPGVWIAPMVAWTDTQGYGCSMIDACVYPPADNVSTIFNWMLNNFMLHYENNRAPFGMFLHAAWFSRGKHYFAAFKKFVQHLSNYPDVYITSMSRMLEYVQQPSLGKPFQSCQPKPQSSCRPVSCNVQKVATGESRYLSACDKCPDVYPWLDNPLGESYFNTLEYDYEE